MTFVLSPRNRLTGKQLGNPRTIAELGTALASWIKPLNYGQGA